MKKALALTLSLLLGVFALAGCSNNKQGNESVSDMVPPTVAEILAKVEQTVTIPNGITIDDADTICTMYDFDTSMIAEMAMLKAGDGLTADEIMVVKAGSKDDLDTIEQALTLRQEVLLDSFAGYAPEEEAKVKNAVIGKQAGASDAFAYAFLCICEDPEAAMQTILDCLDFTDELRSKLISERN